MREKVIEVEFLQKHGLYEKGDKTNMAESTAKAIASKGIIKFDALVKAKTKKDELTD
jgi:hypothetical protein